MATAISSELTCPVCLELFEDPVTLSKCMHSYCRHCLGSILKSYGGQRLRCPECRVEAVMSHDYLQEMPRNFTIANIVAKYEKVDKAPVIPCDLCDEKPPSNAVKSCKECKISYCGQCLFLHPKKGVLATHTLVDPQRCETVVEKKPLQKFCMRCVLILKYEDDMEYCQHDHPSEVMDTEEAKLKMMNAMLESYTRLDDRNKKYVKETKATEEVLKSLKENGEKTKTSIKEEMKRKCEKASDKAKSAFQDHLDEIEKVFQKETKTVEDEYDEWTKATLNNNGQHLKRLQDASAGLTNLIAEMQSIFAAQTNGSEIDFKDIMRTYISLNEVEKNRGPGINLYKGFNLTERLDKVKIPSNERLQQIMQKGPTGVITILNCTQNMRRMDEGASVTVAWSSTLQGVTFDLKFIEVSENGRKTSFIVGGIRDLYFTENRLQHNTTYDVTVRVQDNPSCHSECKRFSSLPGVPCDAFQFSSLVKHRSILLSWDNKAAAHSPDKFFHNDYSSNTLKKVMGAVGTLPLSYTSQYWEAFVSYHLRGVEEDSYAAAVGICAKGKVDSVSSVGLNYFFYGVSFCKSKMSLPEFSIIEKGYVQMSKTMKSSRLYNEKIGFYFDSQRQQLTIIDVNSDSILHTTQELKKVENMEFEYYAICDLDEEGDVIVQLITGHDLKQLPPCLQQALQQ